MKKVKKCEFGYIKYQRVVEIIKTLVMLGLCIATYYIGYLTTKSNKNLLTFVAILGVLPMARCAVNAVLFIKAKGCSREAFDKLSAAGLKVTLFDMYMTQYKNSFAFSACVYGKDSLIFFTEDEALDENLAKEHVDTVLSNASLENITVKIFKDIDKFIERGLQMNVDSQSVNVTLLDNLKSVSI